MLITYPSPLLQPASGVTVSAVQVTSLSGTVDGRAGGLTQLAWGGSEGAPNAEETIRASFPEGQSVEPRFAALVNLENLPAGLSVEVALKEVGGAYDYQAQTVETYTTPSGETAVVAVWPAGLNVCDGVQFTISNTDDAVAYDDEFGLGEIVLAGALELELDPRWSDGIRDPAGHNLSKAGQIYLQPVPAARRLVLSAAPADFDAAVVGDGSMLGLRMALANDPRCAVVVDHSTQARIQRTWIYGSAARLDDTRFESRSRLATTRFQFDEMVGRAT